MADWQKRNLLAVLPPAVDDIITGAQTANDTITAGLEIAKTVAQGAQIYLTTVAEPAAAAAKLVVTEIENFKNDFFGSGGYYTVLHPFQAGVGMGAKLASERKEKNIPAHLLKPSELPSWGQSSIRTAQNHSMMRYLDFPRLVNKTIESFDDTGDARRPKFSDSAQVEYLFLVLAGSPSPADILPILDALSTLLGSKELKQAVRRINQAYRADSDRLKQVVKGPKNNTWDSYQMRDIQVAGDIEKSIDPYLAMIKAIANSASTAIGEAIKILDKKIQQISDLQAKFDALTAALTAFKDSDGYVLQGGGVGGNEFVKEQLRQAENQPGVELSFCVGILFVAGTGGLDTLNALLGL